MIEAGIAAMYDPDNDEIFNSAEEIILSIFKAVLDKSDPPCV
jgi:hypothetical protein